MQILIDRVRASKLSHSLVAVLAALAAAGVTIVIDSPSPGHHTVTVHVGQVKPATVTTTLGGSGATKLTLPPAAQAIQAAQAAQAAAPGSDESALNDKNAPTLAAVQAAAKVAPPGIGPVPPSVTDAAPHTAGCTSAFVRNYSHRAPGSHVALGVIHWTGSTPTLGSPNGGKAIVAWFNLASSQVSSNYVTDQDGRCWYIVPEALKAWTQVSANSWAVSDEITNIGTAHPLFQTARARQAVIRLMIGWHHRWGLPYRHAQVNGSCVPTRSGFLSHKDLGPCGGGHPDVGDFNLDGLIAQAKRQDIKPISAKTKVVCRKYAWFGVPGSKLAKSRSSHQRALHGERRRYLLKWHIACSPKGVASRRGGALASASPTTTSRPESCSGRPSRHWRLASRWPTSDGPAVAQGDRFRITLTLTVPFDEPGGPILALRWIVIRLIDAISAAPYPITVRVERDEDPPRGG
jgi:hypothetical protein